jgi:hypothetical protein
MNTGSLGLEDNNGETEEHVEIVAKEYPDITILYKQLYIGFAVAKFMTENIFFSDTDTTTPEISESEISEISQDIEAKIASELINASVKQELPNLEPIYKLQKHASKITDVETEIYDFFVLKRMETTLMSMSLLEFIVANVMGTENQSFDTFLNDEIWSVYLKVYK